MKTMLNLNMQNFGVEETRDVNFGFSSNLISSKIGRCLIGAVLEWKLPWGSQVWTEPERKDLVFKMWYLDQQYCDYLGLVRNEPSHCQNTQVIQVHTYLWITATTGRNDQEQGKKLEEVNKLLNHKPVKEPA